MYRLWVRLKVLNALVERYIIVRTEGKLFNAIHANQLRIIILLALLFALTDTLKSY